MESIRRELGRLVHRYGRAGEAERERIVARCDVLGGELQELFGLVKLALLRTHEQALDASVGCPDIMIRTENATREALQAVHQAAEEIAGAVRVLRNLASSSGTDTGGP
jgi:hypothetical protein